MAGRNDGPTVDWGAVADPILAAPPWRPGTSRSSQVIAGAVADLHEHDWAGPGFTRPGPEPDAVRQAGYAPGNAEAPAPMTTIFDGPTTSLTGRRHAPSGPVRQTGADGRTLNDRQH